MLTEQYLTSKGYEFLGCGRSRKVFLSPNGQWVVKIPIGPYGMEDNLREYQLWKLSHYQRARCRIVSRICLVMEFVDHQLMLDRFNVTGENAHEIYIQSMLKLPRWVILLDCFQAGYNRKGQLVAYDYAD